MCAPSIPNAPEPSAPPPDPIATVKTIDRRQPKKKTSKGRADLRINRTSADTSGLKGSGVNA